MTATVSGMSIVPAPELTFGGWLTSAGFGGFAAVVAAAIAYAAARWTARVHRDSSRHDQWWDRLKWAVELALSAEPARSAAGLRALAAIMDATGFDEDELKFIANIAGGFLVDGQSGTLESEEDADESEDVGHDG